MTPKVIVVVVVLAQSVQLRIFLFFFVTWIHEVKGLINEKLTGKWFNFRNAIGFPSQEI